MPPDAPEVFVRWESFVHWLLARTEKLPKRLRFTVTTRVDNLALDVFERLAEARYTRARQPLLSRVNLDLEKLRLLLRLLHDEGHLDHRAFAHACAEIDTAGRMVGGWLRYTAART